MKEFRIYADDLGNDFTGAIPQSTDVFINAITADVEETITVPAGAVFALFQSDTTDLWVRLDGSTLTVPVGDLTSQTIMLNPDMRYIAGTTTIRIISPTSGTVIVSFYG